MGIRYGAEAEVWEAPAKEGKHHYSGWYPFVGTVRDCFQPACAAVLVGPYEVSFSTARSLPLPPNGFPREGQSALCFSVETDWYLTL